MSNSLAIAAVTETLRRMLSSQFLADMSASSIGALNADFNLQNLEVTAKPPDKARPANFNVNQINLFLYQVAPNGALRNMDLPRQVKAFESGQPPEALNLHYLITAYGEDDDDLRAHILLGQAVRIFHDQPLLSRADIEAAVVENDLHRQVERVRITPQRLSIEEMSKLWSTFQSQYRVSTAVEVSVVLIESQRPTRTPLPVLKRGPNDEGVLVQADVIPPLPTLLEVQLPPNRASAELGDTLTLVGHHLRGDAVDVHFRHPLVTAPLTLAGSDSPDGKQVTVKIPDFTDDPQAPADWPCGYYQVSVQVTTAAESHTSNELAFALAPRIEDRSPASAPAGDIDFDLECRPQLRPEQRVVMLLSSHEIEAEPFTIPGVASAPTELTFKAKDVPAGTYYIRLRVDGVDSLLIVHTGVPPTPAYDSSVEVQVT